MTDDWSVIPWCGSLFPFILCFCITTVLQNSCTASGPGTFQFGNFAFVSFNIWIFLSLLVYQFCSSPELSWSKGHLYQQLDPKCSARSWTPQCLVYLHFPSLCSVTPYKTFSGFIKSVLLVLFHRFIFSAVISLSFISSRTCWYPFFLIYVVSTCFFLFYHSSVLS